MNDNGEVQDDAQHDAVQRLCSIENANRVALRIADITGSDTVVVRTRDPMQPHRVMLASASRNYQVITTVTA